MSTADMVDNSNIQSNHGVNAATTSIPKDPLFAGGIGGAFVAAQGIGDNPLNLSVDRPEFLSRPPLHLCHHLRVETQQETFPFT